MPRSKKVDTTKKTAKSKSLSSKVTVSRKRKDEEDTTEEKVSSTSRLPRFRFGKKFLLILVLIALVGLVYWKKSWFVAATVNGQPITTLELNQRLSKTYKERTINQMVNEKILEQEARKKGISVTPQEIQSKITEVEEQYGGAETFDSLLAQQGITRDDFTKQTRLQLIVEKMYQNEASPSAQEIEQFLSENKDNPEATNAAKFRETAIENLKQQKLSEIFNQKFQELKQSANVQIF